MIEKLQFNNLINEVFIKIIIINKKFSDKIIGS